MYLAFSSTTKVSAMRWSRRVGFSSFFGLDDSLRSVSEAAFKERSHFKSGAMRPDGEDGLQQGLVGVGAHLTFSVFEGLHGLAEKRGHGGAKEANRGTESVGARARAGTRRARQASSSGAVGATKWKARQLGGESGERRRKAGANTDGQARGVELHRGRGARAASACFGTGVYIAEIAVSLTAVGSGRPSARRRSRLPDQARGAGSASAHAPAALAGVFAPHAKLRPEVVPRTAEVATAVGCDHERSEARASGGSHRLGWAKLMARVFAIDVRHCPKCGCDAMQTIAFITHPPVIRAMLASVGLAADSPEPAPPRLSRQLEMELEPA